MIDQVTSSERSMADMLLEQFSEAEKKFRAEMETMVAGLSRLSGEFKALAQELEALAAAPGGHQKEITAVQAKITENQRSVDILSDAIKARNQNYQTQVELLTKLLDQWNRIIRSAARKIER